MRTVFLLCLCLAATLPLAADPVPSGAPAPASWPDRGPYQKVGRDDFGAGVIKMPRPVVADVQQIVPGDPSRWYLLDELQDFVGHGWHILKVSNDHADYAALLVARGTWTILGSPGSLPVLNEVLDPITPADLRHYGKKANNYLWHIVLLQRHGQGDFLDKQFRHQNLDNSWYKLWTDGTRAQRRDLLALCHDRVVTYDKNQVTVRLNVITSRGAVESWTFRLRLEGQAVRLEGTDVKPIRKAGTFGYPLV